MLRDENQNKERDSGDGLGFSCGEQRTRFMKNNPNQAMAALFSGNVRFHGASSTRPPLWPFASVSDGVVLGFHSFQWLFCVMVGWHNHGIYGDSRVAPTS